MIFEVVAYYCTKHLRQDWGFEGPNLELKCCQEMDIAGQLISVDDIDELDDNDGLYSVLSQSDPNIAYLVNFNDSYTCDCPDGLLAA